MLLTKILVAIQLLHCSGISVLASSLPAIPDMLKSGKGLSHTEGIIKDPTGEGAAVINSADSDVGEVHARVEVLPEDTPTQDMEDACERASCVENQINSLKESTDSELTKPVHNFLQKNPNNEEEDNTSLKENIKDFLTKMGNLRRGLNVKQIEKMDYYMEQYNCMWIQHKFMNQLKAQDEKDIFSSLPKELLKGKLERKLEDEQFISGLDHSQQKLVGKLLQFLYDYYLNVFIPSIMYHY